MKYQDLATAIAPEPQPTVAQRRAAGAGHLDSARRALKAAMHELEQSAPAAHRETAKAVDAVDDALQAVAQAEAEAFIASLPPLEEA